MKHPKKHIFCSIASIIVCCVGLLTADAKYTADFLTLGVGGRVLAMGGAGTALSADAYAPYWNSAALGGLTLREVSFMHSTLNREDAYDFVSCIYPFKNRGAIGVSWLRVGVDDIPITGLPVASRPVGATNRPEVVGTFNNTDNAFLFGSGWRLPSFYGMDFQGGGTLKLLYMSGYRRTNAVGGGVDIGFIGMTNPEKPHQLTLGLQASDAFQTKIYWNTPPPSADQTSYTETIPPHLKIGIATTHKLSVFRSVFILALDTYIKDGVEMHTGAEWTMFDLIALRIGLAELHGSLESIYQLTTGAGLNLRFVTGAGAGLDYAFANHPALGGSHRMSLRIRF